MIATLAALAWGAPDRSGPPPVPPPHLLDLDAPVRFDLGPGIDVALVNVPGVRKVAVDIRLLVGSTGLAGGPTEAARALGWSLDVASEAHDAVELDILRDTQQLELWSELDHDAGAVHLVSPRDALADGLALLGEVLRTPAFPKRDLGVYQRDLDLFYRVEGPTSPGRLANAALAHGWFGPDTPYGRRPDLDALDALRRSDLVSLHTRWLATAPIEVLVVGDVDRAAVEGPLRAALAGLGRDGTTRAVPATAPLPTTSRVLAVNLPGQEQASVRLRVAFPEVGDPDHAAARSLAWALGGNFLSRLNRNLREDKGYTYGAFAGWSDRPGRSHLTVAVDVPADVTAETIAEIRKEVDGLASGGLTLTERDDAARAAFQTWNDTRQDTDTARAFYESLLTDQIPLDDARSEVEQLATLDLTASQTVAQRWLGPAAPTLWVVVGDRTALEPELAAAGLQASWVQADAMILGVLDE